MPLLFLCIRPAAVLTGLMRARITGAQRGLISWFGIRGIGSIYYLSYAIQHGLDESAAKTMTGVTLTTVAASVVLHGVSVTPIMDRYGARHPSERKPAKPQSNSN